MINQRGDLLCPAIDGLTNELLKLGHQVLYINLFSEYRELTDKEKNCIGMISGLSFHKWEYVRNRKFDLIWCAIKDPTPKQCLPYLEKVLAEVVAENPNTPILNDARKLADHTKNKYVGVMRSKNVGAILKTEEQVKHLRREDGTWDFTKFHPASQGSYVSLDYETILLSDRNSQRTTLNEQYCVLKYHNTSKYPNAEPGLRTFFRVPYAAGQCMEGFKYWCPENILCPKSGAAVKKAPYSIAEMSAGTISACMKELGVDIAHIEGVEAGFTVEIFDVNPFPSSAGETLQPMAAKMARRIDQVYCL